MLKACGRDSSCHESHRDRPSKTSRDDKLDNWKTVCEPRSCTPNDPAQVSPLRKLLFSGHVSPLVAMQAGVDCICVQIVPQIHPKVHSRQVQSIHLNICALVGSICSPFIFRKPTGFESKEITIRISCIMTIWAAWPSGAAVQPSVNLTAQRPHLSTHKCNRFNRLLNGCWPRYSLMISLNLSVSD